MKFLYILKRRKSFKLVVFSQNLFKLIVLFLSFSLSLFVLQSFSQNAGVGINATGNPSNSKALLDIDAAGMSTKAGILIPRINTNERNAITAPIPESLLIYNTDTHCFEANYNGAWVAWGCLGSGCQLPAAPIASTNTPSATQIVWNWNTVNGATGYQWNTTSTYPGVGVNLEASPSFIQISLSCNISYTLYVWAYNGCGHSSSTILTQTTSACASTCGVSGNINTFAGTGGCGFFCIPFSGDGGPATSAGMGNISGVAVDASGNVYIADGENNRIRMVNATNGIITTIAGNGTAGYTGDGGQATSAKLSMPWGVAIDASGNVYIADNSNNVIRKVTASSGIITTIAGNGIYTYSGDGGPATSAGLRAPYAVAVDGSGNVYIADTPNNVIRKVAASTGIISTIAGNGFGAGTGTGGYSGDGGQATSAELNYPSDVVLDASGNLYISDWSNSRIRTVTASTGIISTIAGNGTYNYSGDGGPATNAAMNYPCGVVVDASGNVFISDEYNNVIRKVTISTGKISTYAGTGTAGYTGDGGPATSAELGSHPFGIAIDANGNVYIADFSNNRIRKVCH